MHGFPLGYPGNSKSRIQKPFVLVDNLASLGEARLSSKSNFFLLSRGRYVFEGAKVPHRLHLIIQNTSLYVILCLIFSLVVVFLRFRSEVDLIPRHSPLLLAIDEKYHKLLQKSALLSRNPRFEVYQRVPVRVPVTAHILTSATVHQILNHEVGPNLLCQTQNCRSKFKRQCDSLKKLADPLVCIVVRTFSGHLNGNYGLADILMSFKRFEHKNWIALLTNTDGPSPIWPPEINTLIQDDDRVVDLRLDAPKFNYHDAGYQFSQKAIQHCPQHADWLLLTNGDNMYDSRFLNYIDPEYDIIAVDFYSRYTNIFNQDLYGEKCMRFSRGSCKRNLVRLFHTDLGANLLNLQKFRCQNISFSDFLDDGSQDGQLVDTLVYFSWKVKNIYQCLFFHAPNPEMCSSLGHVWDDVTLQCLPVEDANELLHRKDRQRNDNVYFDCIE